MNIDEMEAGPELDTRIEQEIFNRVPCEEPYECGHDTCYPVNQPTPASTDIADAWKVVEELAKRKWDIMVSWENGWYCYISDTNRGEWDSNGSWNKQLAWKRGDTAPHAICLAALEAVKEDNDEH